MTTINQDDLKVEEDDDDDDDDDGDDDDDDDDDDEDDGGGGDYGDIHGVEVCLVVLCLTLA